jgi:hypothetical protein
MDLRGISKMTSNITKLEPRFCKFGAYFKVNALRSSSGLIVNSRNHVHSKMIAIGRIR